MFFDIQLDAISLEWGVVATCKIWIWKIHLAHVQFSIMALCHRIG